MNAQLTDSPVSTDHGSVLSPLNQMTRFAILPFVLGSSAVLGLSSAQAATSSVEQVTIYQGLASVTRALPIKGSGEQTVVFSCL
mgnify:FL=1